MTENFICPICSVKVDILPPHPGPQEFSYNCPRCGTYTLTAPILDQFNKRQILPEEKDRLILSSYLRVLFENNDHQAVKLFEDNFDEMLMQSKASVPSFSEKMFKLLTAIEKRLQHAADTIDIRSYQQAEIRNYLMAMSYSLNEEEFFYYIDCIKESGYIKIPDSGDSVGYQLTPTAWEYLEEHKAKDRIRSEKAFIAIDFDKQYEPIYQIIAAAVNKAGYKPIRADKEHYSDYIMDWVTNHIKEARFIVAELTSKNLGVYYEFGYAKALGMPIIACLRKEGDEDPFKKVHFDLKQFPLIIYESPDERYLDEKIFNRILNLVGRRG